MIGARKELSYVFLDYKNEDFRKIRYTSDDIKLNGIIITGEQDVNKIINDEIDEIIREGGFKQKYEYEMG